MNEVLLYLQMHHEDLTVIVDKHQRFITFQAKVVSFDQVTLPLSCQLLYTSYFRLFSNFGSSPLTDQEKRFAAVSWEILNILKENFPSKILLSQENLEVCKPIYLPMSSQEELRRQVSCVLSLKEEGRQLMTDEIEDLWQTLQFAERLNDQKAIGLCLEILSAQYSIQICDETLLGKIISRSDITSLQSNKALASEVYEKFMNQQKQCDQGIQMEINSLQSSANTTSIQHIALQSKASDKNTSSRMCLFQLSESNDINRVATILQTLTSKSKETLSQMSSKFNLTHKLLQILKKYCNSEYGFDHEASKNGTFQYYLCKLMIINSSDYAVFLEYLQSHTMDWFTQIIEEAVILAYDQAKQAEMRTETNDLHRFLKLSLVLFDLTISKNFAEYLPTVRDNLRKIQARFTKIIQTKEVNPLLQFFINNQPNGEVETSQNLATGVLSEQSSSLSYEQLTCLRQMSETLYSFAMELNTKLQRVEGFNDTVFENHEEKYLRLFPLLAHKANFVQRSYQQTHDTEAMMALNRPSVQQDKRHNFIQVPPTKQNQQQQQQFESLPTFSGYKEDSYEERNFDFEVAGDSKLHQQRNNNDNQENLSTNVVYLKNKNEQGFKRNVLVNNNVMYQQQQRQSTKESDHGIIEIPSYYGNEKQAFKMQQAQQKYK